MEIKVYTIEDLADGICSVKNDGTLEELFSVLKWAFPQAEKPEGKAKYFKLSENFPGKWMGLRKPEGLPAQSVKDFLVQLPEQFDDLENVTEVPDFGYSESGRYTGKTPKHRIRKQEIADHLGIPVDQLEIVE